MKSSLETAQLMLLKMGLNVTETQLQDSVYTLKMIQKFLLVLYILGSSVTLEHTLGDFNK